MGDHSEAIQIDFDPTVTSYGALLADFFDWHNACSAPYGRQYRSAIFPHDRAQRDRAEASAKEHGRERGRPVATAIEDFGAFTLAEDYHQKYRLRSVRGLIAELEERYPTRELFLASPTVTRANAFVAGSGTLAVRDADLPRMGLSAAALERLQRP